MTRLAISSPPHTQQGAVLFISLILLIILTLIGVTAARLQTGQEAMARNDHNHQLAIQVAEAALRSAEASLSNGMYTDGDFATNTNGLYELNWEVNTGPLLGSYADTPFWNNPGVGKPYAGPALNAVPNSSVPQFMIENLPPVAIPGEPLCTESYGAMQACSVYRVTAHATGGDQSSNSTLQSIFH